MHGVGRIIAISDAVRDFHIRAGLPARKLVTIHYGLDELPHGPSELTPEEAGIPAGAPLVLAIGRLIEQKDHATLLDAFAQVRREQPDARLAILGWGRLETETRARVHALGLEDAVARPGSCRAVGAGSPARTCSRTRRAGRDSGSSCSKRCWPACRSSRRG